MLKYVVVIGALIVSYGAEARVLTAKSKDVEVSCTANKNSAFHSTTVTLDPKVKFTRPDNRLAQGGGVERSCELARVIETQLFAARQLRREIEFDTETFKTNITGEQVTDVLTDLEASLIDVECKKDFQGSTETAYRTTTITVASRFFPQKLKLSFQDTTQTKEHAVLTQCGRAQDLQALLYQAKKDRKRVDLNTVTMRGEFSKTPAAAALKTQSTER